MASFQRHATGTVASPDLLLFLRPDCFQHPATKSVDFDASIGGALDGPARELLSLATSQRAKLEAVIADRKAAVDPRNVAAAVEAYLPSVWRITTSFEASAGVPIKLNSPLSFTWNSPLAKKSKDWTFGVLIFEVVFVLSVRALSHRDAARVILAADAKRVVDASKELRMGAGIFEFLRRQLLPRWSNPPPQRPLETLPAVLHALESLYLADAQRFAVQKAVDSGTQPSAVCKLLMGCADKYDFAARALRSLDAATFESLSPNILEELGAFPAILRAVAANELAQHFKAKDEPAKAAGLARDAFHRLSVISMGKLLQASPLQRALDQAKERAQALALEYENECTNVYFCVPETNELGWPEEGSFIVSSLPYEMPTGDIVSFREVKGGATGPAAAKQDSKSFFEKLWPSSSATSGAGSDVGDLKPPPGVDPTTFAELPEAIQKELAGQQAKSTAL